MLREHGVDRLLDLGSGGGFPGLPLVAALPCEGLLVESIGKKARFLETTVDAVGLTSRARVASIRAEQLGRDPAHAGRWPAVTARAVAALPRLLELAMPLLRPGGVLLAWKRGDLRDELDAARSVAAALGAAEPQVRPTGLAALAEHRLVIVPRAPGVARPAGAARLEP